jgi:hypothetical protein
MLKDHSTELRDELLSKNTDQPELSLGYGEMRRRANSYPRLVEALRELLLDCEVDLLPTDKHPARALLKELGEWRSE